MFYNPQIANDLTNLDLDRIRSILEQNRTVLYIPLVFMTGLMATGIYVQYSSNKNVQEKAEGL